MSEGIKTELLLCPFCGGEASEVLGREWEGQSAILCNDCTAETSDSYMGQTAIEKWNTRATPIPESYGHNTGS